MLIENDNNIGVGWNEKVFINRRLLGIKSRTNRLKDIRIQAEDYLYLSAGTIVVINGDGVREYLSVEDWNSRKDEGLEAIGIVVVPNTHTDDGKGRMMSLRLMSVSDPDNGSLVGKVKQSSDTGDTQFYYPAHGTEFNNNEVGYPCIFSSSSQTKQTFSKFVTKCAFTTTSLEEKNYEYFFVNNKFDKGDWYPCYSYSSGYAPSPYEGERGINPLYRYSGCSTSELNGEINTKKLLEYYGDVLAALGAETASSADEIA